MIPHERARKACCKASGSKKAAEDCDRIQEARPSQIRLQTGKGIADI